MASSTNLYNLRRRPFFVLTSSPFFVLETKSLAGFAAACATVYAPIERKAGTRRWLMVFALGHAGVSIAIAAGLRLLQVFGGDDRSEVEDVGTSYASRTLLAASVYMLGQPWRQMTATALLLGHIRGAWRLRGFSDVGHLLCIVLGLRMGGWLVGGEPGTSSRNGDPGPVNSG